MDIAVPAARPVSTQLVTPRSVLARPIGAPTLGLTAVLAVLTLVLLSDPVYPLGGGTTGVVVLGLAWGPLLAMVVARAIGCMLAWVTSPPPRPSMRAGWVAAVSAVLVATSIAIGAGATVRARFGLSRGALTNVAREARRDDPGFAAEWHGQRVGLYEVETVDVAPQGVVRLSTATEGDRAYGVAYAPDHAPGGGRYEYRHLSGDWYLWAGPVRG